MPNYQQIREWDDSLAVVEVRPVADAPELVTMTYADGVCHTVSEAYFNTLRVQDCCCICGDPRSGEGWECPGCGSV